MTAQPAAPGRHTRAPDAEIEPEDATRLDELLFHPSAWFCIDAGNVKVAGITPGRLDQALALVGRGRVATVVGALRPEVVGVDVDGDVRGHGQLGDDAADAITTWCATRRLWHLRRPSGGGPGRWHVLVVPGVHRPALLAYIDAIRAELGLTRRRLDVRTQLRPLSAPHRTGAAPTHPDGLDEALSALQGALQPLPGQVLARRASAPATRSAPAGGPEHPLTPLPRPARDLPDVWAGYLARGRAAAGDVDTSPDRSLLELRATTALVIAGHTELSAWDAITASHAGAFTKAKSRGRRWWWTVWNRAVIDADTWLREHRGQAAQRPTAPLPATAAARRHLDDVWRTWAPRTRHTDREVMTVVLDRMDRVGATSIPVPQRDLVLDCAVTSRTTVRAALVRLQGAGLLQVLATYRPGTTDTAHTLHLPERPSTAHSGAVSLTGPSRFQPPQRPRPPLPARRALGLVAASLLEHLPAHDEPAAATLTDLVQAAGLLDDDHPTARQTRTVRAHLQALAHHQLAVVDAAGTWRRTASEPTDASDVDAIGQARQRAVAEHVHAERTEFRARFDADQRRARWQHQRARAIARCAKTARAAQRAWWGAQPPADIVRRRAQHAAVFAALDPVDQAHCKHHLAQQRAGAGEIERHRYDSWLASLSPTELDDRSMRCAVAFAVRPPLEQQQLVAAWADHRARWGLPAPRRAAAPSDLALLPERRLLARASPTTNKLVDDDLALISRTAAVEPATAS